MHLSFPCVSYYRNKRTKRSDFVYVISFSDIFLRQRNYLNHISAKLFDQYTRDTATISVLNLSVGSMWFSLLNRMIWTIFIFTCRQTNHVIYLALSTRLTLISNAKGLCSVGPCSDLKSVEVAFHQPNRAYFQYRKHKKTMQFRRLQNYSSMASFLRTTRATLSVSRWKPLMKGIKAPLFYPCYF